MENKVMKAALEMQANENLFLKKDLVQVQFPQSFVTSDGYPNATEEETGLIPIRSKEWFTKQITLNVFVSSVDGHNGFMKIESQKDADALHDVQAIDYRFTSQMERIKQTGQLVHQLKSLASEPVLEQDYQLKIFLNGTLKEKIEVRFLGLTDNLKWYLFYCLHIADTRLLPVGEFPAFLKRISNNEIVFEQYTPLSKI